MSNISKKEESYNSFELMRTHQSGNKPTPPSAEGKAVLHSIKGGLQAFGLRSWHFSDKILSAMKLISLTKIEEFVYNEDQIKRYRREEKKPGKKCLLTRYSELKEANKQRVLAIKKAKSFLAKLDPSNIKLKTGLSAYLFGLGFFFNIYKKWLPGWLRFDLSVLSTHACNRFKYLSEKNKIMTENTCKNRFCLMCSRTWGYKLGMDYLPVLMALDTKARKGVTDPAFYTVTLTVRNCTKEELADVIKEMGEHWRKMLNLAKHLKNPLKNFSGLRKFECHAKAPNPKYLIKLLDAERKKKVYNGVRIANLEESLRLAEAGIWTYHPHYHITILGQKNARFILRQWMKYNPNASRLGQKIQKSVTQIKDNNIFGCMKVIQEFFKYLAKPMDKTDELMPDKEYAEYLLYLYTLIKGKPIIRAFGDCKKSNHHKNVAPEFKEKVLKQLEALKLEGMKRETKEGTELKAREGAEQDVRYKRCYKKINYVDEKGNLLFEKNVVDATDPTQIKPEEAKILIEACREVEKTTTDEIIKISNFRPCPRCKKTACGCILKYRLIAGKTQEDIDREAEELKEKREKEQTDMFVRLEARKKLREAQKLAEEQEQKRN